MASSTTITQQKKPERSLSPWQIARRKFVRNKLAMISSFFILLVTLMSLSAPFLAPVLSPLPDISKVNIGAMNIEPNGEHLLGTDKSGRDVLTRLFYGGRISLLVGFSATLIVITLGTVVGALAGFFGGFIDSILMRFTDFVLNFPFLVFVIVLNTILYGIVDGLWVLIMVIGALSWGGVARLVRSKVLAEKENEYILAALSIGCSPFKVITKHLLPNVISTIIVQGTLIFATMIVIESALSYLGFGVPQATPSWGNMLSSANEPDVLQGKPWIWMPPAIIITLTILSINFIGEGLKDALNPKSLR
ncbi:MULTISPECIES: oligopeptide ABC transporter permease [unclassified Planococcus (in: firmicutes)]|uniref:oligopeptide ABC transporter permease n=1 Tax=Planococcus TaxID=1372 RepID=UPI000C339CDF|nr:MULTISPECIES: oligopeptide ABC transporter permease [unclassified Planococcus (in: firmicutes)]AUD14269.1 peptide ABC transporter permease [Planococcus sp. MB-3u-03]PKG48307.1 peptide ABC transporter permease [Planococcus sp. Urea-trap-24]PKG92154.1 peptide ABC transporter permease [Planococcus sp. Urea-3u-39]PKH42940.1 peptide ABC transporter permease [Planococcus sp. MB-3u-09]